MTKLKMKRFAGLLAACLLLAALAGCSNTKSGNTGTNNGATGTPTSYTNGSGYGLDNYGGQGYNNGNGAINNTMRGLDNMTGGSVSADM